MRLKSLLPLLIFLGLAAVLWVGLGLKPREVPTVMIGRAVPEFDLPPLDGRTQGLASAALRAPGVKIVNVFASWCVPCRVEHPQLSALKNLPGIALYGINYKDNVADARAFLDGLGDPFAAIGYDRSGRVSIDWGVYGVPETYVVDGDGKIVYRHVGPISDDDLKTKFTPLIERLREGA